MALGFYIIIIEPVDRHYRAYPLAVPEVVAQGKPLPIERRLLTLW